MKIKTEQLVIGGLLLWFLLARKNSRKSNPAPPLDTKQPASPSTAKHTAEQALSARIRSLEHCYHAVV